MAGIDYLYGVPQKKRLTPLDLLYGAMEMGANIGTGTLAQLGGGLTYLPAAALGGDQAGQAAMRAVNDAYTYQPRGPAAQQAMGALNEVVAPFAKSGSVGAQAFADNVYSATGSPTLGAAARAAPTAIELLADRLRLGKVGAPGRMNVYDTDVEKYGITHRPPRPNTDTAAPFHSLEQIYPDDVYSPNAASYYGTGDRKLDSFMFSLAKKIRNNPDAEVTIYRAVPKENADAPINAGDWVTATPEYARMHGESLGDYSILSKKVKARELWTNGDSIHEFGWWPQGDNQ